MSGQITNPAELRQTLRQMLAVLQAERQALAGLDIEAIMGSAGDKAALCGRLDDTAGEAIDAECRGLLDAARRLNEVNRQLRNLIAANVSQRLEALTGVPQLYRAQAQPAYAYAQAGRV
ncbi:MAG: flagellar protein FlgN [Proteobacteria bacterium]|nr:flagellar protein FlgN [Pseudomonadota bacterium]